MMKSGFISLGEAAEKLAGANADANTVECWVALLEAEAEQLKAVKEWITGRDKFPGGISFERPPKEWRISVSAFKVWCKSNGHELSLQRDEAPTERKNRLIKRRNELKAHGAKNFNVQLAKETGVSVPRIKQLLKE